MTTPTPTLWRKSSYSGGGEGNDCVEIAELGLRIAIRDSKNPSRGTLSVPAPAFTAFVGALKEHRGRPA
ncbi:DUF397 domain-containing protein [Streptomyces sp. JHA26]|uniref:DUF397 domain-containing protein n=1 Tax=Streptomyces sp. JHA26 TaxID=1917143 RepID=UPI00098AC2DE|nr:DUF397 domain-containing protein [Streptomyces sp. JHA26]